MARDPSSLSFLPLADAYRRRGKRDAALKLCLRGLERHPEHTGAHLLLSRIYLEAGDQEKAYDEWGFVLRLDPANFDAHRGLGFFHLERGELQRAHRHLEQAVESRPEDPLAREALRLVRERETEAGGSPRTLAEAGPAAPPPAPAEPAEPSPRAATPGAAAAAADPAVAREAAERPAPAPSRPPPPPQPQPPPPPRRSAVAGAPGARGAVGGAAGAKQPRKLFAFLEVEAPYRGALLLDKRGLVLAGSFSGAEDGLSEALGAIFGGAIEEAARTADLVRLGAWRGMLMHAAGAVVHLGPIADAHVVLLAADRDAPTGWVLRSASRAADAARAFLGETGNG